MKKTTMLLLLITLLVTTLVIISCNGSNQTVSTTTIPLTTQETHETVEPQSTFELINWEINGSDSWVSFSYEYYCESKHMLLASLIDPQGNLLEDKQPVIGYTSKTSLGMNRGKGDVPEPGIYKFIVKTDTGNPTEDVLVFTKTFTFSKANVTIEKITPNFKLFDSFGNSFRFARIDLLNDGDLPIFLRNIPINVSGTDVSDGVGFENENGDPIGGWLNTGRKSIYITGYSNVWVQGGNKIFSVAVYDDTGVLVAEKQIEITLPYKPEE